MNIEKLQNKVDPLLLESVNIKSTSKIRIIVLANEYEKLFEILQNAHLRVVKKLPFVKAFIIDLPPEQLEWLSSHTQVEYICSDIKAAAQMNIASKVIGADKFHKRGLTGKGISVAVIDTGIFPHADFTRPKNRIRRFIDFVNHRQAPYDDNGHGTFVTGVLCGNGYKSKGLFKGIAPNANIISLKTMDSAGGGTGSSILEAMQYVSDNHKKLNIKVLSMSLGAIAGTEQSDILSKGAKKLWDMGIFVVAAAGNSGPYSHTITSPGVNPSIMTVGASDDVRTVTTSDDMVAEFSSRGPANVDIPKPDIVAPGVNITSCSNSPTSPYTVMSGTSVSTPIVAGAALLYYEANSRITPDKIKSTILKNAISLDEDKYAQGKGSVFLL